MLVNRCVDREYESVEFSNIVRVQFEDPFVLVPVVFLDHQHALFSDHFLDDSPRDFPEVLLLLLVLNRIFLQLQADHIIHHVPLSQFNYH